LAFGITKSLKIIWSNWKKFLDIDHPKKLFGFRYYIGGAKHNTPELPDPRVKKNFNKNKNKFGGIVIHLYL
jgi:hypothetical protein